MLTQTQIATIEAHIAKATKKHADFCRNVTEKRLQQIKTELAFIRQENDIRENHNEECLELLVEEELLELCEAYIEGNAALEKQECYDVIALLIRRIQQLDYEGNLKFKGNLDEIGGNP